MRCVVEYDEIDQYVDQLFRETNSNSTGEPLNGEVLSGDWRIDRIDQIIQDAYDEAIWWHNNRISEGSDPRSGLRNLPYIPWDERIDGVAAMQGAIGGLSEGSYQRNGGNWHQYGSQTPVLTYENHTRGLTCAEVALIIAVVISLLIFMMINS